ncbi:ribosomal protein S6 kinase-related protein isoform X2 [Anopheles merus]|uniref:ribosomal protein S6 kinase-related protein isoform X2 n=1 Tax=Anopheles merus TaxID=30066 RepID=UPI001BE4AAAE|nr:ribosomal protein S6 kinase-related protein isoform X2 [Anopheles merus]
MYPSVVAVIRACVCVCVCVGRACCCSKAPGPLTLASSIPHSPRKPPFLFSSDRWPSRWCLARLHKGRTTPVCLHRLIVSPDKQERRTLDNKRQTANDTAGNHCGAAFSNAAASAVKGCLLPDPTHDRPDPAIVACALRRPVAACMGDADIRATEPAISCANAAPDTDPLRAGYTQRGKDRRKEHLVVSFQLPPAAADVAHLGPLGRWYHETLAHRRCIVWLQGTLSRTIYVLRCVPPHQHSHRTRPPVARISRRRWHQTTLDSEAQLLKSCWPVPERVRLFLPTFPVDERRAHRYAERTYVANGAFGRVYRVRDTLAGGDSRRWYALKVLQKSNIVLSDAVGQVRDEVKIQTVCGHHPFIVPCVDYWQDRTRLFLLSEFFSNGELFHRLKSFTSQLVQLYVAELALAIDFLHNAGIIYRDLKPENVLLDDRFHLKLIDFGLSKWLSVGSRTGTLCGTIQYMVPSDGSGASFKGLGD